MFTLQQIENAHDKVKSGADFPTYISEIKQLGVVAFETWVSDSHTKYFGEPNFSIESLGLYPTISIEENSNRTVFLQRLKVHQNGETDYFTFCKDSASTGIEKWKVDLKEMTCTYFDKKGAQILIENIPNT